MGVGVRLAREILITVEGPDGVGKTSLAEALVGHLEGLGMPSRYLSFPGRQPGTLGGLVYEVHHHPEQFGIMSLNPTSRQLLHVAAQIDEIEGLILPAVRSGQVVVLDRFWWSVWVYGMVEGADQRSLEQMIQLELRHWSNMLPAIALLVDREAPLRSEPWDPEFSKVRGLYQDLALAEGQKYPVATLANEGAIEDTLRRAVAELRNLRIVG